MTEVDYLQNKRDPQRNTDRNVMPRSLERFSFWSREYVKRQSYVGDCGVSCTGGGSGDCAACSG